MLMLVVHNFMLTIVLLLGLCWLVSWVTDFSNFTPLAASHVDLAPPK